MYGSPDTRDAISTPIQANRLQAEIDAPAALCWNDSCPEIPSSTSETASNPLGKATTRLWPENSGASPSPQSRLPSSFSSGNPDGHPRCCHAVGSIIKILIWVTRGVVNVRSEGEALADKLYTRRRIAHHILQRTLKVIGHISITKLKRLSTQCVSGRPKKWPKWSSSKGAHVGVRRGPPTVRAFSRPTPCLELVEHQSIMSSVNGAGYGICMELTSGGKGSFSGRPHWDTFSLGIFSLGLSHWVCVTGRLHL